MPVALQHGSAKKLPKQIYSIIYNQWHMSARGLRYLREKSGLDECLIAVFIVIAASIYLVVGDYAQYIANSILVTIPILLYFVFPEEKPPYENHLCYWCLFSVTTSFFDRKPEEQGAYYLFKMILLKLLIVFPPDDIAVTDSQKISQKEIPNAHQEGTGKDSVLYVPGRDSKTTFKDTFVENLRNIDQKSKAIPLAHSAQSKDSKMQFEDTFKRDFRESDRGYFNIDEMVQHSVEPSVNKYKVISMQKSQTILIKESEVPDVKSHPIDGVEGSEGKELMASSAQNSQSTTVKKFQSTVVQKPILSTGMGFQHDKFETTKDHQFDLATEHQIRKPEIPVRKIFSESPVKESQAVVVQKQTVDATPFSHTEKLEVPATKKSAVSTVEELKVPITKKHPESSEISSKTVSVQKSQDIDSKEPRDSIMQKHRVSSVEDSQADNLNQQLSSQTQESKFAAVQKSTEASTVVETQTNDLSIAAIKKSPTSLVKKPQETVAQKLPSSPVTESCEKRSEILSMQKSPAIPIEKFHTDSVKKSESYSLPLSPSIKPQYTSSQKPQAKPAEKSELHALQRLQSSPLTESHIHKHSSQESGIKKCEADVMRKPLYSPTEKPKLDGTLKPSISPIEKSEAFIKKKAAVGKLSISPENEAAVTVSQKPIVSAASVEEARQIHKEKHPISEEIQDTSKNDVWEEHITKKRNHVDPMEKLFAPKVPPYKILDIEAQEKAPREDSQHVEEQRDRNHVAVESSTSTAEEIRASEGTSMNQESDDRSLGNEVHTDENQTETKSASRSSTDESSSIKWVTVGKTTVVRKKAGKLNRKI